MSASGLNGAAKPRTQFGTLPGYTNPLGQTPDFINLWDRPPPVTEMGRSPGLMETTLRGCILGAGQVRRMWRQAVNYIPASPPYSWTENRNVGSPQVVGVGVTRALRYMTRSFYVGSGIDYTHFSGLHTEIQPRVRSKPVTIGKGQTRSRPTVRNRMTSFGSRVQTLNETVSAAEGTQ